MLQEYGGKESEPVKNNNKTFFQTYFWPPELDVCGEVKPHLKEAGAEKRWTIGSDLQPAPI